MFVVEVDGYKAWATVIGGFMANFILGGLAKSYGLVLDAYQSEFESDSALLTLAGGLIYTFMMCLSLPIHFIVKRIGRRPVIMVGGIGSCISLLIAALAPNLPLWVAAIGIGIGCSFACVYFNVLAVIGECFRDHLGLANGLSVTGVSVGQMAFPSMVSYMMRVYGVRMGTILMGAFCLHFCITAVLMPSKIVDPKAEEIAVVADNSRGDGMQKNGHVSGDARATVQERTSLSEDVDAVFAIEKPTEPCSIASQPTKLTSVLLAIYVIAKIFGDNADVGISFIAPPYGRQLNIPDVTVNRAIAVSGGVDLISRLFFGWLSDRKCCRGKRGLILGITWLVEGINGICFGELSLSSWDPNNHQTGTNQYVLMGTYPLVGYYVCFAIHGICSGTAMTQMVVVLLDWVGAERFAQSLAITMLTLGLLMTPCQFVVGYLNDLTGTYAWPMRMMGFWLLIAGVILLMEFPARRGLSKQRPSEALSARRRQQKKNGVPLHAIVDTEKAGSLDTVEAWRQHWSPVNSFSDEDMCPSPSLPEPRVRRLPAYSQSTLSTARS